MIVCLCAGVPSSTIAREIDRGAASPEDITAACGAGGDCGACLDALDAMLAQRRGRTLELAAS